MQFPEKLTNQTLDNGEKPNFGPNFGLFGLNLSPPHFFVHFSSASSHKLFQAIILCNLKET